MKPFELFCDPLKFASYSLFEFLKISISHCGIPDPNAVNFEVPSVQTETKYVLSWYLRGTLHGSTQINQMLV